MRPVRRKYYAQSHDSLKNGFGVYIEQKLARNGMASLIMSENQLWHVLNHIREHHSCWNIYICAHARQRDTLMVYAMV